MKCTYCGGTEFREGPSGGMAINVLCANPQCRHWFNDVMGELQDLNRVEPTEEEKATTKKRWLVEAENKKEQLYQEGADHYRRNLSALDLLKAQAYGGYAEARDNVIRLAGFLDAMAETRFRARRAAEPSS